MNLTLTGIDESNTPEDLIELLNSSPGLELGALYSANPLGRPRYPSHAWLARVLPRLGRRCALHVCGGMARQELLSGEIDGLAQHCGRIQINGTVTLPTLELALRRFPWAKIITQLNPGQSDLFSIGNRHQVLVDASGGRGLEPPAWEWPSFRGEVGFAGGLNALNIRNHWDAIQKACPEPARLIWAWLDLETGVRGTDDRFNLSEARAIIANAGALHPVTPRERECELESEFCTRKDVRLVFRKQNLGNGLQAFEGPRAYWCRGCRAYQQGQYRFARKGEK